MCRRDAAQPQVVGPCCGEDTMSFGSCQLLRARAGGEHHRSPGLSPLGRLAGVARSLKAGSGSGPCAALAQGHGGWLNHVEGVFAASQRLPYAAQRGRLRIRTIARDGPASLSGRNRLAQRLGGLPVAVGARGLLVHTDVVHDAYLEPRDWAFVERPVGTALACGP